MNHYPLWKNIVVAFVVAISCLYALPNLFGEDPAVQISPPYAREMKIDAGVKEQIDKKLKEANLPAYLDAKLADNSLLLRYSDTDSQLKAYSLLKEAFPEYVVAQNLVSSTPSWLLAIGARPMFLGLDLRGGVHFLMQVDMNAAVQQEEERLVEDFRTLFREKNVRYRSIGRAQGGGVSLNFSAAEVRGQALELVKKDYPELVIKEREDNGEFIALLTLSEKSLKETKDQAVEQNTTTLRNRVNELGVAEPIIQRQGTDRIVVQLPGVQDTARAKEILGATATLEFRLTDGDMQQWFEAQQSGKVPVNSKLYKRRDGSPVLLKRSVIVTGDQINDAASTIDQRSGSPATVVRLNNKGATRMYDTTKENVGKPMAVVFIEYKVDTKVVDGKEVKTRKKVEEVINVATVQEAFGKNFQITGLTSGEARNLSLLLRAGALKAPMEIIEERTIGPSLGKENIEQGWWSIILGYVALLLFLWARYSHFGMIANFAMFINMVMTVAMMSVLQATLTLPGLAGLALSVGMAVDANILIYERIREELRNGNSPQNSIHVGFEKASGTITDSNLTALLASVVLFAFGTGPVKGFAVTTCLGIIASMFCAVIISRAIINYMYGGKKLDRVPVEWDTPKHDAP